MANQQEFELNFSTTEVYECGATLIALLAHARLIKRLLSKCGKPPGYGN